MRNGRGVTGMRLKETVQTLNGLNPKLYKL